MSIWDEKGEAVLSNGQLVSTKSEEGKRILRQLYGRNYENYEKTGTIYDKDGGFYLDG